MIPNWQTKKLGEICDIQTGKWDANHNLNNGKYRFYTCAYKHGFCNTNRFSGECLILPGNGVNVGEVFYYHGDFDAYQRTYVLNNIKIFPKFLYYHLFYYWRERNLNKQFGSATNFLKIGNFLNYEVVYPDLLSDQQRIVEILDEAFEKIEKVRQNAEKNLQNSKNIFQYYLENIFINPNKGWENKKIGEVCSIKSGTTISPKLEKQTGDILYIKVGDMNLKGNATEILYSSRFIDPNDLNKNQIIPEGSIIFPKRGGAIFTNKRRKIVKPTIVDLNIMALVPSNLLISDFLYYWFLRIDLKELSNGTSIPQINNFSFDNIFISYPKSVSDQKKIAMKLDKLSAETKKSEAIYQQKLADLEELKKSILNKAFNGEL